MLMLLWRCIHICCADGARTGLEMLVTSLSFSLCDQAPLQQYDVTTVLGLQAYASLMQLLQPRSCKDMAVRVVQAVLGQNAKINTPELVDAFFTLIAPLVEGVEGGEELDEEVRVIHCWVLLDNT